jgi:hypothetical protein
LNLQHSDRTFEMAIFVQKIIGKKMVISYMVVRTCPMMLALSLSFISFWRNLKINIGIYTYIYIYKSQDQRERIQKDGKQIDKIGIWSKRKPKRAEKREEKMGERKMHREVLRMILYFISIKEDALAKLTNAHTENTQHREKSTSFIVYI